MAIKKKIEHLLEEYRFINFKRMLDANMILCKGSYTLPQKIFPNKTVLGIKKSLYEEEDDMNGLEKEVINEIADLENIVRWHRIIERQGFYINGPLNHYPDFMLYTSRGNCILIETKGPHLDNTDSKKKIALGNQRQNEAGKQFKYFMVFKDEGLEGAYSLQQCKEIIASL